MCRVKISGVCEMVWVAIINTLDLSLLPKSFNCPIKFSIHPHDLVFIVSLTSSHDTIFLFNLTTLVFLLFLEQSKYASTSCWNKFLPGIHSTDFLSCLYSQMSLSCEAVYNHFILHFCFISYCLSSISLIRLFLLICMYM